MASTPPASISAQEDKLVRLMQLLGDKTRYQMFKLVASNETLCVSEIAAKLGISASAVSQHFKLFEDNELVTRTREGQRICYKLHPNSHALSLLTFVNNHKE